MPGTRRKPGCVRRFGRFGRNGKHPDAVRGQVRSQRAVRGRGSGPHRHLSQQITTSRPQLRRWLCDHTGLRLLVADNTTTSRFPEVGQWCATGIDNEPEPIAVTLQPDGTLTGPGSVLVKGRSLAVTAPRRKTVMVNAPRSRAGIRLQWPLQKVAHRFQTMHPRSNLHDRLNEFPCLPSR